MTTETLVRSFARDRFELPGDEVFISSVISTIDVDRILPNATIAFVSPLPLLDGHDPKQAKVGAVTSIESKDGEIVAQGRRLAFDHFS